MTKKILAGVLSAVTLLSLSVTASATSAVASPYAPTTSDATVSAPGATTYKVDVGQLECVLDVVVPTTIKAFLNPYNSDVQIADVAAGGTVTSGTDTIQTGITSYAYIVANKSEKTAVGIDIVGGVAAGKGDVELLTTDAATKLAAANSMPTTTDDNKKARDAELAKYAGKKAYVVLAAGNTSNLATGTLTTVGVTAAQQQAAVTKAKALFTTDANEGFVKTIGATCKDTSATSAANGVFVFTEDEKSLENFIKLEKNATGETASVAAFTFAGICQNIKDASGEKEDWTAKDGLTINFALKVHP